MGILHWCMPVSFGTFGLVLALATKLRGCVGGGGRYVFPHMLGVEGGDKLDSNLQQA